MTKEELKQEAVEYVCKRNPLVTKEWFIDAFKKYDKGEKVKYLKDCEIAEYETYLASAEPREKQITGLSKHILELQKDKGELIDKVRELENKVRFMGEQIDNLKAIARYDQFTKAKNIIKNLMIFAEIDNREYEEAYKEAEQFINEVYK